jgi:hypothetical protein
VFITASFSSLLLFIARDNTFHSVGFQQQQKTIVTMRFQSSLLLLLQVLAVQGSHVERDLQLSSFVGNCMQDNWTAAGNPQNLVCAAKEVTMLSASAVTTQKSCTQGDMIQITIKGDVQFNAERWDPGWYVATDVSLTCIDGYRCALLVQKIIF